jgi:hypothetical protein
MFGTLTKRDIKASLLEGSTLDMPKSCPECCVHSVRRGKMSLKNALVKMLKAFAFPLGVSLGTFVFCLVKGLGFDFAFSKALIELAILAALVLIYEIVRGQ